MPHAGSRRDRSCRELDLPSPRPTQVSVKAAVLPFARFPERIRCSAPRCARRARSWQAPPTSRRRSRRRNEQQAGRCRPQAPRSSRFATRTSPPPSRSPPRSPGSASSSSRPKGPARTLRAAGLEIEEVAKVADAAADEATVVDLVRRGRCDLVDQHPAGKRRARRRLPDPRGGTRRARSLRDDDLRGRGRGARDRERPRRIARSRSRSASGSKPRALDAS